MDVPWRVVKYVLVAIVAWVALSLVLFLISAQIETGNLPSSASNALSSGGNMLFSADNVLILGTDQRPAGLEGAGRQYQRCGQPQRHDHAVADRRRHLAPALDPARHARRHPGHGTTKINAAYAYGGPALAIKTVEQFTGVKINHVIIVNLAAFPQFIDAIGGVDVTTGKVCADISGGTKNGGFSLYLSPGTHHLNGIQALTYARMRENSCNPADSDLTRVQHQQQILNGIKAQLFSPATFFRLPWASWDAPKVLRTDMGGLTLLTLFAASEIGGSAPVEVLPTTPTGGSDLPASPGAVHAAVNKLING